MSDPVNPYHYKLYPIETIDMMVSIWGREAVAMYCEINAFKYRMRVGTKISSLVEDSTTTDLRKERWYLNKAKELREGSD